MLSGRDNLAPFPASERENPHPSEECHSLLEVLMRGSLAGTSRFQSSVPYAPDRKCFLLLALTLTKKRLPAVGKVVEPGTGRAIF